MNSHCLRFAGRVFLAAAAVLAAGGMVVAQEATNLPPTILTQPPSKEVYAGDPVTLGVQAAGSPALVYYWYHRDVYMPGSTPVLVFPEITAENAGTYRVVVSNSFGKVVSEPAEITVKPNVARIVVEPKNLIAKEGTVAAIGVVAAGLPPKTYNWFKNGTNLPGFPGPTVIFSPVKPEDAGEYYVTVSNVLGSATSSTVSVTVKPNTPRQLSTGNLEAAPGRLMVPVGLAAQGDENLVSFSLDFKTAVVRSPKVTLAAEAAALLPGVTLLVADSASSTGSVGIFLSLPPGQTMPKQTIRLVDVAFDLVGADWPSAGLNFGNAPTPLVVKGATNQLLPVYDVVLPSLSAQPMSPVPNSQSGLFQQVVRMVNPGAQSMDGVQVLAGNLGVDSLGKAIRVQNRSGAVAGVPYVYYGPLDPAQGVDLTVEFYVADRTTMPRPVYEQVIVSTQSVTPIGQAFAINNARFTNGVFLVEFQTFLDRLYYVQYRDSLEQQQWSTALPPILGTGRKIQWIDNGPPKTISHPTNQSSRFYRGLLLPL